MKRLILALFTFSFLQTQTPTPQLAPPAVAPATVNSTATPAPVAPLSRVDIVSELIGPSNTYIPGHLAGVVLSSSEGDKKLASLPGSFSTTYAFVTVLIFADFPEMQATTRIKDPKPSIWVRIDNNPRGRVFLVKPEVNKRKGNRSVKLGRSGYGSVGGLNAPDSDWVVSMEIKDHGKGLWELVPTKPLEKGEYGIFAGGATGSPTGLGGELFDFAVE